MTLGGTVATEVLLLDSVTKAPPDGVNAVNQIVADDCVVPVCTVAGSRMIESSVAVGGGGAGGVTVIVTLRVTPLYVAEMTDVAVVETAVVDTTAEALPTPAGTVTLAGTVATAVLLLDSATTAPPLAALAVSVTVADEVAPP